MGPGKAFGCVKTWSVPLVGAGRKSACGQRCVSVCRGDAAPLRCLLGSWMSGLLPWADPLSWDGEVAVDVLVVDVLTDCGPEAATKQETEKVVEVELNSRRRREDHFAWMKPRRDENTGAPSSSKLALGKAVSRRSRPNQLQRQLHRRDFFVVVERTVESRQPFEASEIPSISLLLDC